MSPAIRSLSAGLYFLSASLGTSAQTLNPTADAYVRDGTWANTNFGTAADLYTKTAKSQNHDSYLKFDTAGVGSVASAKLRVMASLSGSPVTVSVYPVSDTAWSESAITWNNRPARGSALASVTVSGSTYVYYEFDVSTYVISEKTAGRNIVSFALHNPQSASRMVWWKARETTFDAKPQLVITANNAPTISISAPAANQVFQAPANIMVSATAADSDGTVTQVQFFANGAPIGTDTTAPYSVQWANVAAGSYVLTAAATDNSGTTATSTPVNITVNSAVATLYFVHADHLNTPRLVANELQQIVWRWDQQEPFGVNVPDENPSGLGMFNLPLRLPGQYFDKETNLHYNYFRDYDPSLGIYKQSDPIGLDGGLNTYSYVSHDPLRHKDFFGLAKTCGAGKSEPFTPNFAFEKCCGEHDDCYDDCTNKPPKERCDNDFTSCVLQQCSKYWIAIRFACETAAVAFSEIVNRAGGDAFNEARRKCANGGCKKE